MNFYKHHIGDYAAATAHLTFTEDAAFTRLLRIYYRDERPLPVEVRSVQRLAGARMPEELEAVETVLREFFTLSDDGWHNKRCDEEISAFKEMEADAAAKRENEAERQRRHRERRKELFDELRVLGVVPAYDVPTSELESMLSRQRTKPVTRTDTANQTPDSRLQTPEPKKEKHPRERGASKKPLPADFSVSERVEKWAESKGYGRLADHLEAFKGAAIARGYRYADWDQAFMNAIRDDWAKLRVNGHAIPAGGGRREL